MDYYDEYGPAMMLPHTRYDDLEHLKAELEQEKRYREGMEWSNSEMERSIGELETYLRDLDDSTREADDNEWKVRFESQTALNKQLTEQKDWLETELAEARRKLTTGSYPEAMNFNLDALNEAELLRLVKHLERMRNDYYSTLRDTEWKLDKESKEFHHFDEMRRVYKADLKHANQTIERMRLSTVLDPSGMSPLYPSGYFRDSRKETKSSKSPSRKGRSKSPNKKDGSHSPTRSPTRSKSRNEKRSKKKEEPAEEPPPGKSETDHDAGTEGSGPDPDAEEKQPEASGGGGGGGGEASASKEEAPQGD